MDKNNKNGILVRGHVILFITFASGHIAKYQNTSHLEGMTKKLCYKLGNTKLYNFFLNSIWSMKMVNNLNGNIM